MGFRVNHAGTGATAAFKPALGSPVVLPTLPRLVVLNR